MKKIKTLFLLIPFFSLAQVGISTTNPTATLEIATSDSEPMPPFEIESRSVTPTGTSEGQFAVIDNMLYAYNQSKNKWLSLETIPLICTNYALNGNSGYSYGSLSTTTSSSVGIKLPYDGTIVAITFQQHYNSNASNKNIEIRRNYTLPTSIDVIHTFTLTGITYNNNNTNIDFNSGDYLSLYSVNDGVPGSLTSPVATLFIKWRKDNP
jgi:hypothetical protein